MTLKVYIEKTICKLYTYIHIIKVLIRYKFEFRQKRDVEFGKFLEEKYVIKISLDLMKDD